MAAGGDFGHLLEDAVLRGEREPCRAFTVAAVGDRAQALHEILVGEILVEGDEADAVLVL
ncbi:MULTISPECIES: hypothetical protein [unclassified Novosphingobium]|uniref:hypothetical protein n=1 Tax=unclassified Novosphingobium TaxID=2644732 RepID=UPI00135C532A|nr:MULTISPECIES: hypothetical protein [unclassified Novosphingobium]